MLYYPLNLVQFDGIEEIKIVFPQKTSFFFFFFLWKLSDHRYQTYLTSE